MSLLLHTCSSFNVDRIVSNNNYCFKILKYIINDITYIMISHHNTKYNVLLYHDICKVKEKCQHTKDKSNKTLLPDIMMIYA